MEGNSREEGEKLEHSNSTDLKQGTMDLSKFQ